MIYNREQIKQILPHREPFLLVDEVEEFVKGESIRAIKYVTGEEDFFKGHFPEYPVMPGVLILEALAQAGGIVVLSEEQYKGKIALFAGADEVKFRQQVRPGDKLELEVAMRAFKMGIGSANATAKVDGKVVCTAIIKFAIMK